MEINEWKLLSNVQKTKWIEENHKASAKSKSSRGMVMGIGVNDATFNVKASIHGGRASCPAYSAWKNMIERCFSTKRHKSSPTYARVTVCDEWLSFMSFRSWWIENQVDGWQLDKDIIGDGLEYSPLKCIYIPSRVNLFLVDRRASRGSSPIGSCFDKRLGGYISSCSNSSLWKIEYLGFFESARDAHLAWRRRKLEMALEMKNELDEIDNRIYPSIISIIMKMK